MKFIIKTVSGDVFISKDYTTEIDFKTDLGGYWLKVSDKLGREHTIKLSNIESFSVSNE